MIVYRFALYDIDDGKLFMSTELDEPDPSIDAEFWYSFMTGNYQMQYLGQWEEVEPGELK